MKWLTKIYLLPATLLLAIPYAAHSTPQQQAHPDAPIKLNTELIVLDVQAINRKTGQPVGGLSKDDFLVYEDGVKQTISHFSQDKLPLSILLLLDLSGSQQPKIEKVRDGAEQALKRLKPEDEVAVMGFGTRAKLIQDFTIDRQQIIDGLEKAKQMRETGMHTYLNEAVYQAALHIRRASNPSSRRVILVITDNIPSQLPLHKHSEREAIAQLLEPGSVVCGLITTTKFEDAMQKVSLLPFTRRVFSMGSVKTYAKKTGGEVMGIRKEEIETKLVELIERLRTRYAIGYTSSNTKTDGKFRKIKLKLSPDVEKREGKPAILTRQGYYARRLDGKAAEAKR